MSVDVFALIGLQIEDPKTFKSLSQVCRNSRTACKRIEEIKRWHFERLFIAYDSSGWKVFANRASAHHFCEDGRNRPQILLAIEGKHWTPALFKMRRIELFNLQPVKVCDDYPFNCLRLFRDK